jgi:hypothetical protein
LLAVTAAAQEPGLFGPTVQLDAPTLYLPLSGDAYVVRAFTLDLPPGETVIAYPFARFETPLDAVRFEVLSPTSGVQVGGAMLAPESKDVVRWSLTARDRTRAQARISHPLKGVEWRIEYTADLDRTRQKLTLNGQFFLTNRSIIDWHGTRVQFPDGTGATVELPQGQSTQIPVAVAAEIPYEAALVCDPARYGNGVTPIIRAVREGGDAFSRRPLLPGKVRIFAAGVPREYLGEDRLPFLPASEPLEMNLPAVNDVVVVRRVAKSTQVEPRTDIRDKVVLYHQDDELEYEVRNLRRVPVMILVRDKFDGDWIVTKTNVPVNKADADTAEWSVTVQAGETRQVTYTVRRLNQQP